MTIKVLVGSRNPVKIGAVHEAFACYFDAVNVVGFEVDSQVGRQPVGEATFAGAQNRATALVRLNADNAYGADFVLGLEGGVIEMLGRWFAFGAICILDTHARRGFGASPLFELPDEIARELLAGAELGDVIDRISGDRHTKRKGGAIGYLTRGQVDRKSLYVQGIMVALVPFLNEKLFFGRGV